MRRSTKLAATMRRRMMSSSVIRREDSAGTPGLGSSYIRIHDHVGYKVKPPPFLKTPKTVSLIGAPLSFGQPIAGTDQGPKMLRDAGLVDTLVSLDWRVSETGDLHFNPPTASDPIAPGDRAKNSFCVGSGLEKISNAVYNAASRDEFALVLGGDHSIAAGSIAGVLRKRPETAVIWVDAHGDLNTPATSPSGNIHGMPLAFLMNLLEDRKSIPGFEWMDEVPTLRPEQLVFVGLRDLDDGERDVLRKHKIKAYTMQHIDRYGVGEVMEQVFDFLREKNDGNLPPLHLSYDIDAVDPEFAPSTGTVVRGGLNFREAHYVAEAVSETGMLGSCDMVEVNPMLKPGNEADLTVQLGMRLIASIMGSRIL